MKLLIVLPDPPIIPENELVPLIVLPHPETKLYVAFEVLMQLLLPKNIEELLDNEQLESPFNIVT